MSARCPGSFIFLFSVDATKKRGRVQAFGPFDFPGVSQAVPRCAPLCSARVDPCYPSPCPYDISSSLHQALYKHRVNCPISNYPSWAINILDQSLSTSLSPVLHSALPIPVSAPLQNALLKELNILPSPLSAIISSIGSCTYAISVPT